MTSVAPAPEPPPPASPAPAESPTPEAPLTGAPAPLPGPGSTEQPPGSAPPLPSRPPSKPKQRPAHHKDSDSPSPTEARSHPHHHLPWWSFHGRHGRRRWVGRIAICDLIICALQMVHHVALVGFKFYLLHRDKTAKNPVVEDLQKGKLERHEDAAKKDEFVYIGMVFHTAAFIAYDVILVMDCGLRTASKPITKPEEALKKVDHWYFLNLVMVILEVIFGCVGWAMWTHRRHSENVHFLIAVLRLGALYVVDKYKKDLKTMDVDEEIEEGPDGTHHHHLAHHGHHHHHRHHHPAPAGQDHHPPKEKAGGVDTTESSLNNSSSVSTLAPSVV